MREGKEERREGCRGGGGRGRRGGSTYFQAYKEQTTKLMTIISLKGVHEPTNSSAVMKDVLEELQAFSIQERITGSIEHKYNTVGHLTEASLPKEPSGDPPLLGEEGRRGQPCTVTVHPSERELVDRPLLDIILLEWDGN